MSLIVSIRVNEIEVERVILTRIDPLGSTPVQDEMCTYILRHYTGASPFYPKFQSEIKYPYQTKNPLPLIQAAIKEIPCSSS